jgi:hypothetical protein
MDELGLSSAIFTALHEMNFVSPVLYASISKG